MSAAKYLYNSSDPLHRGQNVQRGHPIQLSGGPERDARGQNNLNDEVTAPGDVAKSSSTLRPKEKRTLWIGDLDRADKQVDDNYVKMHMFYEFSGYITGVRICRDKITRQPSFGFVEFVSQKEAQYVLEHMNGRFVPGRMHKYRLNWANFNLNDKPEPRITFSRPAQLAKDRSDHSANNAQDNAGPRPAFGSQGTAWPSDTASVWVGSLDPHTCREEVEELFEQHYSSVCFVKLIMDPGTGACKGFGFVHFRDPEEAERALEEMNGAVCRGRRIRVNRSNTNRPGAAGGQGQQQDPTLQSAMNKLFSATALQAQKLATEYCGGFVPTKRKQGVIADGRTEKVVVRGVDVHCTEEEIRRHFGHFGEIILCRTTGCGKAYITFAEEQAAHNAALCMNGAFIGTQQVCVELAGGASAEGGGGGSAGSAAAYEAYYRAAAGGCGGLAADAAADPRLALEGQNPSLQLAQAALFAQYYDVQRYQQPDPFSAGGAQSKRSKKRTAQPTEEDLDGRLFSDADPLVVPPELLPAQMFAAHAIRDRGTMERHVFRHGSPCQARLDTEDLEKFEVEQIDDELSLSIRAIDGAHRKRLKTKVCRGLPLQPEDQEHLYNSYFEGYTLCF